jgi:hypothetical protein
MRGGYRLSVKKTRQNLEPFAGVGVTHRRREEAEAEGQHDDVQHEMLLCAVMMIRAARGTAFSLFLVGTCHPGHRFSRWE